LEKANVSIQYHCPEKALFTLINREQMERAVYNLLSNAVKFSRAGSNVDVTLSSTKTMACLTVEDQGDGIAPHVQGTLFHRYMREPAIEDSRYGLGLGMTLVRSAAAIHGGTVLLEKTAGTRVTMTIAIRKAQPGQLRSPALRVGDYAGGKDLGLLEFSEILPSSAYDENR
jgi:signal transduction histidine kinase